MKSKKLVDCMCAANTISCSSVEYICIDTTATAAINKNPNKIDL